MSVFCAKIKIKPTEMVTVNFKATKAGMFELTKPANTGLSSRVPKYRLPITVVKQSMEPIKIRNKLGRVCVLCKIGFSPFSLRKRFSCNRYKGDLIENSSFLRTFLLSLRQSSMQLCWHLYHVKMYFYIFTSPSEGLVENG
jgi:hypothetical protein